MSQKRKEKILFIWDKIKNVPDNGKYWIIIGLALSSQISWSFFDSYLISAILSFILAIELFKHFRYELTTQNKLDEEDMMRAERIYDLMENDDGSD